MEHFNIKECHRTGWNYGIKGAMKWNILKKL